MLPLIASALGAQGTAREAAAKPRDWAESQLHFAGFVAFSCLARKDTGAVVGALKQAGQYQAMITGDAPLTALQVAAEVRPGISARLLSPQLSSVSQGEGC